MTAEIAGLVDTEHGMISRRIFIEPEIYETELRRILPAAGCFCATIARSRGRAIS